MNEDDRKILQRNRTFIIENIHNIDDVNSKLFEYEIFSQVMREEVEMEKLKDKKIRKLIDLVPRRGPKAFKTFIQVLVDTNNRHVAEQLHPGTSLFQHHVHVHPQHSTFQSVQEELPATWPDPDLMTQEVKVTQCQNDPSWPNAAMTYRMSRFPRGRVLMFNNKFFSGPKGNTKDGIPIVLPTRDGTDADEERLTALFSQLHFTVEVKRERKAEQMQADIADEIYKEDHRNADCFILVIMTHGCREGVYGCDGIVVNLEWIKEMMNGANFPLMTSKPKLIFIQGCRGDEYDQGVTTALDPVADIQRIMRRIRLVSTIPDSSQGTKEPTGAHILIAMSTTLDMVSFRNRLYGSWFLQAIVYVFQKFAYQEDIFKLMMKVSNLVSKGVAHDQDGKKELKTISVFESSLTNNFYFYPGLTDSSIVTQPTSCMK